MKNEFFFIIVPYKYKFKKYINCEPSHFSFFSNLHSKQKLCPDYLVGPGLMDKSVSPGNLLNALPRSCALRSTEWQQALTASLVQQNLHRMVPAPEVWVH